MVYKSPDNRIIDHNADGFWSVDAVVERYRRYCAQLDRRPDDVAPRASRQGDRVLIFSVMESVIAGIKRGDPACVTIGIEFLEEDRSFFLGMELKSRTARAIRQSATLDEVQQARLRRRFADMLVRGYLPREYKEYAKLFRKIGLGLHREAIEQADQSNSFILHWRAYLLHGHPPRW
jgi:hypothetical protein